MGTDALVVKESVEVMDILLHQAVSVLCICTSLHIPIIHHDSNEAQTTERIATDSMTNKPSCCVGFQQSDKASKPWHCRHLPKDLINIYTRI